MATNGTNGTSHKRRKMAPSKDASRPVRIAGCSGGFTDRSTAITRLASDANVDAVIGDWLSEMTMTLHGAGKRKNLQNLDSTNGSVQVPSLEERRKTAMYADTFLQCFEPAIPQLVANGTKLAVNAGASDTELLALVVRDMLQKHGQGAEKLKVSWIEGDDVTDQVFRLIKSGESFESLMHGKRLEEWGMEPVCAQAYLGGLVSILYCDRSWCVRKTDISREVYRGGAARWRGHCHLRTSR